ncbi:MAG: glycosyltransferase N-terminal domain-containing protein [Granulosicoccaceae bacterium]
MSTKPAAVYRFIARLISPLWLIYTVARSIKDGGRSYLFQRFGFYPADKVDRIWIHAASVGEVNTVLPLLQALQSSGMAQGILVSTNTPTGKQTLLKQLPDNCIHRYLPVDLPGACKQFLSSHRLSAAWIMETEIWPWLYSRCHSKNLPLTIINGRITEKTLRARDGLLGPSYAKALEGVSVMAKDENEAERYRVLSNNSAHVTTVGNLKYGARAATTSNTPLLDTRYCVAASTHDDEETQLATAWMLASANCTLVIVPRHPERGVAIKDKLRNLGNVPLRSKAEPLNDVPLYIADTLGELEHWFAHAQAVFMGGSLIDRGGHNLLEPARFAKLIVTGPSMSNFKDETRLLEDADGLMRANSASEAVAILRRAVNDTQWAKQLGTNAQQAISKNSEITDRYLKLLLPNFDT